MKVVLLQPPMFRFLGSHNDRAPMELCYASAYLEKAGIEHIVINADATLAQAHIPWSDLWRSFPLFMEAVDGKAPLYNEVFERVMGYDPEVVVLAAGDSLMPGLESSHPWIGVNFSQMFRRFGIKTVGVGRFYGLYPSVFLEKFDVVILGPACREILQAITKPNGLYIGEVPLDIIPSFDHLEPKGQKDDYLLTSFGCIGKCDFCFTPKIYKYMQFISPEVVKRDMERRSVTAFTVRDNIFPVSVARLRELRNVIGNKYRYGIDIRADSINEQMLEELREFGVRRVKVGVETFDDAALLRIAKGESVNQIDSALRLSRQYGMQLVVYVILGYADRAAYEQTYRYVEELRPDSLVVNIHAYYDLPNYHNRYDCHFSLYGARQQGIDEDILWRFLRLEDELSNKTIKVLARK